MSNAAEEIYIKYKNSIYNYFYRLTFNGHTAEDLTQETFLKSFKYFSSFRGESSIKTWLFKIARNTYITFVRKNSDVQEEDITEYKIPNHEDSFSRSDEKMLIRRILSKLTEEERTLIILRDLNGFTYSEIASIMGFTEGKVKIGLHRARKKFRQHYNSESKEE